MKRPVALNESCLQWSFGETLDETTIRTTLSAFQTLEKSPTLRQLGVTDVVPSYNKLAVHFSRNEARHNEIEDTVTSILNTLDQAPTQNGPLYILTVDYAGEDLTRVANHCGISTAELITRHIAPEYLVAMVGFQPHFPYLFGLDPILTTPRLDAPRLHVPAGSVAIGGAQTGIYPSDSPGGWNLIGQTDPAPLRTLRPGDRIRFTPKESVA